MSNFEFNILLLQLNYMMILYFAVISFLQATNLFLVPEEIKPPQYVKFASMDASIEQENYGERLLSVTAVDAMQKYQSDIDSLSSRLGETSFGRANFLNPAQFQKVACCYPEVPKDSNSVPIANGIANLTSEQVFVAA